MVQITTSEHTVIELFPDHPSNRKPPPKRFPWRITIKVLVIYAVFLAMMISIAIANKSP